MSKKKVLLVDDEKSLCRVLKLNLEETGEYFVRTETKGADVLSAACQFKPDVIVLDFVMPDIDGGELAKQIKADPRTKDIPIIFLTAIATKEDTDAGGLIGGHYVLAKPVTVEELSESIERKIAEGEA